MDTAKTAILSHLPPLEGNEQFAGGKLRHVKKKKNPDVVQFNGSHPDPGPKELQSPS